MDNRNDVIDEVIELEPENTEESTSSIVISPDVVASIAGVATSEIDGVAGMCSSFAGGIAEILGAKKNITKGIKVDIKENVTVIDLYIIVEYGKRIPELAWEIQESVKNNVETMTGLKVEKVNIHIDGVSFKKSEQEENENLKAQQEATKEPVDEIIIEEAEIEDIPEDDEFLV